MNTSFALLSFVGLIVISWLSAFFDNGLISASLPWTLHYHALYISGLLSVGLMSLVMVLSTRPVWLEGILGGMDRVYRLHKWAGIYAILFAATHWLIKLSSSLLKDWYGRAGRIRDVKTTGLLHDLQSVGKDLGEIFVYVLIIMLLITLIKRFPYKYWRHLHRIMPVVYLVLVFHATVLAPLTYWKQPVGYILAAMLLAGSVSSAIVLFGLVGKRRKFSGYVVSSISREAGLTQLVCKIEGNWTGHHPGQFAFIQFDKIEGAHPFTIASADHGDRTVTFQIKALGDFTRHLFTQVSEGQQISIEGPYGQFELSRCNPKANQIWVAGGVGVTPFLAWLDSLRREGHTGQKADLHYFTSNHSSDPFVTKLNALCAELPFIQLHIHHGRRDQKENPESLVSQFSPASERTEVWFCGPTGLADCIRRELSQSLKSSFKFHQEAFDMR